ncbi:MULTISPECIES: hypothetical protein [unclassified Streptomyces]|uniref:hypothetical protein n=1 Tax=unclassified Streptomyces TaxID=2593676 RepID=UPI003818E207
MARKVKNQRLASVSYVWAFASLTASPGARAHYDRRRADGDRHTAAQPAHPLQPHARLPHHCLTKCARYDELTAFLTTPTPQLIIAACQINFIGCLDPPGGTVPPACTGHHRSR